MKFPHMLAGLAMLTVSAPAFAATKLVDLGFPTTPNGGYAGYVVQSFTATIDNMAGLEILVGGSSVDQIADISAELFSDKALKNLLASGVDPVDTSNQITGNSVDDIAEVEWAPVGLTLGETYYLRLDTTNSKVGFYIFGRPNNDYYAGGQLVAAKDNAPNPFGYYDLASVDFYTDPSYGDDPALVPLPAGAPLLLSALGLLAWRRRR